MNRYFWHDASGISADIERHMEEERYLQEKIHQIESRCPLSDRDARSLRVYQNCLVKLQQSKAEATTKLGKSKEIKR